MCACSCGSETTKCSACDVGFALVPSHPKEYTALYGFAGSTEGLDSRTRQSIIDGVASTYSWWSESMSPPLCVLCSGFLDADGELAATVAVLRDRSRHLPQLCVFLPEAAPERRDLARVFAALFHNGLTVQFEGMYLPSALPMAVYVQHPAKPDAARLLVSKFHTLIADEKRNDLLELLKALVSRSVCFRRHAVI